MKIIYSIIIVVFSVAQSFTQSPDPAFEPMTANGAIGISLGEHILQWSNPSNVDYNEVYFSEDSALVANLDPSVRLYNGNPSTVYSSALLNIYGPLTYNTKYFWRVVEFNPSGSTASSLWYFKSRSPSAFGYENFFDTSAEGWQIFGPMGFNNWYWSNTSAAGGPPGEMVFRWDPVFIGDSYLISPEFPAAANSYMVLQFNYYEDWWSDTVVVGCAYTTDNGNSWTSVWEMRATGNVGPDIYYTDFYIPGNFRLGFYYTGDSNNIDFLFVDNVGIYTPITVPFPPSLLRTLADTSEQKVELHWDAGSASGPITGYQIQRKNGAPTDPSPYLTIITVDSITFSFEDLNVELDNEYTYRICTLYGPNSPSCYGNEATAYVPLSVPVELISFTGNANINQIELHWQTATETNNSGFEVERSQTSDVKGQIDWEKIGFVPGSGTTTEPKTYAFIDENLSAGIYHYRLKQIDYDGSFEYSNVVEIEVIAPTEFSLEQNYPNPFNPSTNIKYSIPADGNVTLKVYDVLGNEVTTLVNGFKQAGTFDIIFDGSNLSSGVYYYRLTAGEMTTTKKLMLLR